MLASRRLTPLAVTGLVTVAAAQVTHHVGPGGFAQIQAALAVAAPGDLVVVQPGDYAPFHLTLGVTIRGTAPTGVTIAPTSTVAVPAGQVAHLLDLRFGRLVVSGECTLDRCAVGMIAAPGPSLFATNARLRLQDSTIGLWGSIGFGATHALEATDSSVSATGTSFRGSFALYTQGFAAGSGIVLQNSTLVASAIDVMGGFGYPTTAFPPQPGIVANASTVWISDSTITGGHAPASHGSFAFECPVVATAGRLVRSALEPTNCPPGIPTTGALLGVRRPAPMQSGAPFTLEWPTDANGIVVVFASAGLGDVTIPIVEQPSLLDHATMWPLAALVADGTGLATGTWALPPNVANLVAWFQGVAFTPTVFVASPVAGGVVR